ncbi:oxidoreductase [Streptomyces sp. NPDC044780]
MFERTSAAGRQSARVQETLMSPDAAQKILTFFRSGRM